MATSPTLRDVAFRVGMGKSTVQRVLAGIGSVSPRARERVTQAAAKLGYVPDPLFSILSSRKRRYSVKRMKMAYIHRKGYRAGTSYFPVAAERGKILGYQVEEIELAELGADMRLMEVLYHRGFAGVIVGRVPATDHAAILANTHFPLVRCGRLAPLPIHTIQSDVTEMTRLAWRSMIKAGYRRIGAAIGSHSPVLADDLDRVGTILQCQADIPLKERIPPLRAFLGDSASLIKWFRRYKPDAVLGFSSAEYYTLYHTGIDMARIGYAALHTSASSGDIAGIVEPAASIAREAVNLLDQLIRHRSIGVPVEPFHILVPGIWQEGISLPAKPDSGKRGCGYQESVRKGEAGRPAALRRLQPSGLSAQA